MYNNLVQQYRYLQTSTEDENVDEAGEEVLCVRAFGVSYMALGISIRSFMVPYRSQCFLASFGVYDRFWMR